MIKNSQKRANILCYSLGEALKLLLFRGVGLEIKNIYLYFIECRSIKTLVYKNLGGGPP